jgi:hypothetical protein
MSAHPRGHDLEPSDQGPAQRDESERAPNADTMDGLDDDPTGPMEDALADRELSSPRRGPMKLPGTRFQLPPKVTAPPRLPAQPHRRERQVNVKLSSEDYDSLAYAADEYGVAPTTLARMLVRRGVLAMVRGER